MKPRRPRTLGRLGEKTLSAWATQVDITCNKADEDDAGWDFLLEFPESEVGSLSTRALDLQPSALQCFIQVKASDERPGSWNVKLDNWVRRIDSPLPAFHLVFEFDGANAPQRAYLVHVDTEYVYRVKRRLRELSAKGKMDIHKHHISFTYDESHLLTSMDGAGLAEAIQKHIGPDLHAYSTAKIEALKTVGYENSTIVGRFIFEPPDKYKSDPMEFFVDHQLGLVPRVPIKRLELNDSRFDIIVPEDAQVFSDCFIEMITEPVGKAKIEFSLPGRSTPHIVETDIKVPMGLPVRPRDRQWKARFYTPLLDVIIWPARRESTLTYNLPVSSARLGLKSLWQAAELIRIFHEAAEHNLTIDYELFVGNVWIGRGFIDSVSRRVQVSEDQLTICRAIDNAWRIAKHFDIDDNVDVSTMALERQIGLLEFVASTVEHRRGYMQVSFYPDQSFASSVQQACCPLVPVIQLGTVKIVVGYGVCGEVAIASSPDVSKGPLLAKIATDHAPIIASRWVQAPADAAVFQKSVHDKVVKHFQADYEIVTLAELHRYLDTEPRQ